MAVMPKKHQVGAVGVVETPCENPYTYRGILSTGTMRVHALLAFKNHEDTTGMELWLLPPEGGAKKISSYDVDWERSGL